MIWKTKITELTKIKYPLIMGAFGGWGKSKFASIFSNAGGLGIIAALNFPDFEDFREDLKSMKQLTNKPFGVNLSLPHSKLGSSSKKTRSKEDYLQYVKIALEEGVNIFTTSGYKAAFIGQRIHESEGIWIHKCVLMKHALSAGMEGADAVSVVGLEGTGFKHPLTNTTLVNITMGKKLLSIPIIAAGGIGDGRGFLSTLFMGAEATCLGTALMTTLECPAPLKVKMKWINQNIFSEDFYTKIYHYNTKNFMAPSTAIGHVSEMLPLKEVIENLMGEAENILKSWGFVSDIFNTRHI